MENRQVKYKKGTGFAGVPKWGSKDGKKGKGLPLDFTTPWKVEINFMEGDLDNMKPSEVSRVFIRFHSSEEFASMPVEELVKKHGGIHVRFYTYDGIDKTEEELYDWVYGTPNLIANDNKKYNIYNSEVVNND